MIYSVTNTKGHRYSFVVQHIAAFRTEGATLLIWANGQNFFVALKDADEAQQRYSDLLTLVSRYWSRR